MRSKDHADPNADADLLHCVANASLEFWLFTENFDLIVLLQALDDPSRDKQHDSAYDFLTSADSAFAWLIPNGMGF